MQRGFTATSNRWICRRKWRPTRLRLAQVDSYTLTSRCLGPSAWDRSFASARAATVRCVVAACCMNRALEQCHPAGHYAFALAEAFDRDRAVRVSEGELLTWDR